MRYLIFLLVVQGFLGGVAFAFENCFPVGKEEAKTVYADCAVCESAEGQQCFSITEKGPDVVRVVDKMADDLEKPIWKAAYNLVSCADKTQQECAQMVEHQDFCIDGDRGFYREADGVLEGYCTRLMGYEQMVVGKKLEVDPIKKAAKDAQQAQRRIIEEKIANGLKRKASGERIIALIVANNDAKNLTVEQSTALATQLQPIISALQIGTMETAKALTQQLEPDGVIVKQEDLDLALAMFAAEGY